MKKLKRYWIVLPLLIASVFVYSGAVKADEVDLMPYSRVEAVDALNHFLPAPAKFISLDPRMDYYYWTLEQLEYFLANDDTDHHLILIAPNGVNPLQGVCMYKALQLVRRANEFGKYLSIWAVGSNHVECMALVGKDVYQVDPDTDGIIRIGWTP